MKGRKERVKKNKGRIDKGREEEFDRMDKEGKGE